MLVENRAKAIWGEKHMESGTKILIGAGLTALLAWGSHSAFGGGVKFVDGLEAKAQAALASNAVSGVTAVAERDPQLKRVIILSGDKSDEEKAKIIAQMKAIPGVADARWADGTGAAVAAAPAKIEAPATKEAVAECQGDVNAITSAKTINFRSGSAYLAADGNAVIDEIAKVLTPCKGTAVEIQGHTDLIGNADTNTKLSQQRADVVMAELVKKGVPADRLKAKGYGSAQPIENAMNPAANAKNRRTVFSVSAAGTAAEGGN
jgi:OmpA-OmpF porin, OOP family